MKRITISVPDAVADKDRVDMAHSVRQSKRMDAASLPAYLDSLQRRERAARRAVSVPLLVHTVALAVAVVTASAYTSQDSPLVPTPSESLMALPLAVYLIVWAVMRVRAWRTGIGPGHDGWGIMAIVSVVVLCSWLATGLLLLGAVFFLGLGLVVLGARLHEALLWGPGPVLMVVGASTNLYALSDATFLGPWSTVVLVVLTLGLAATTVVARLRERRTAGAAVTVGHP